VLQALWTLFYAAAVFAQEAVTISGERSDYAGRFLCLPCGSSGFARSNGEIEIRLGLLNGADHLIPKYVSWTVHLAAWLLAFGHTTS